MPERWISSRSHCLTILNRLLSWLIKCRFWSKLIFLRHFLKSQLWSANDRFYYKVGLCLVHYSPSLQPFLTEYLLTPFQEFALTLSDLIWMYVKLWFQLWGVSFLWLLLEPLSLWRQHWIFAFLFSYTTVKFTFS